MFKFQRESNFRCPRLKELAREADYCCSCKRPNDGTIVGAHSNALKHGHGGSIKAHDLVAFVCMACHDKIDRRAGGLTREESHLMFLEAFYETVLWLLRTGRMVVK